jgi:hypothetical protein
MIEVLLFVVFLIGIFAILMGSNQHFHFGILLVLSIALTGCGNTQSFTSPSALPATSLAVSEELSPSTLTSLPSVVEEPSPLPGTGDVIVEDDSPIPQTVCPPSYIGQIVAPGTSWTPTNNTSCDETFLFAIFRRNDSDNLGDQTLVSLTEVLIKAGHSAALTGTIGAGLCFQSDGYIGITKADVESGKTKINPGQTGQPGFVQAATAYISPNLSACAPVRVPDLCKNIEGRQNPVPADYTGPDVDGNCTLVPPPPPPPPVPPTVPPVVPPVVPPAVPPPPPVDPLPPVDPPCTVGCGGEEEDVPPPPPPNQCSGPFAYSSGNPFNLANSGDATELAHVRTFVSNLFTGPSKVDLTTTSWTSTGNYPVVVVKAAQTYWLYVNVVVGQVLQSHSFNQNNKQQNISHVSRFVCGVN